MFRDVHMSVLMSLTFLSCQAFYDSGGVKIPFLFNCDLSWRSTPFLSGPDWGERPFTLRRPQGILAPDERVQRFSGERPVETVIVKLMLSATREQSLYSVLTSLSYSLMLSVHLTDAFTLSLFFLSCFKLTDQIIPLVSTVDKIIQLILQWHQQFVTEARDPTCSPTWIPARI